MLYRAATEALKRCWGQRLREASPWSFAQALIRSSVRRRTAPALAQGLAEGRKHRSAPHLLPDQEKDEDPLGGRRGLQVCLGAFGRCRELPFGEPNCLFGKLFTEGSALHFSDPFEGREVLVCGPLGFFDGLRHSGGGNVGPS